jgi:hypothetical protein
MGARAALVAVILTVVAGLPTGAAAAQASWLDAPPTTSWNTPGGPIPQAPPTQNPDVRCRTREVAPSTPEQSQLAARGWRLQDFWPPVSSGGRVVLAALAEYDGMCRPFEFNVFVFSNGQFAGTLSPVNMNSRFDGALFSSGAVAVIGASGTIAADFIRYADTDPLCCPSGGVVHVVYGVQQSGGQPVVVLDGLTARPAAPAQVPAALPATGGTSNEREPLNLALVALGGALIVVGARLRRPASNGR